MRKVIYMTGNSKQTTENNKKKEKTMTQTHAKATSRNYMAMAIIV